MDISIVDKVKKSPIPISHKELVDKYIRPYIWDGYLWIDGGWGAKEFISSLDTNSDILKMTIPLSVEPHSDFIENEKGASFPVNQKYRVAFPGEQCEYLFNFIDMVANQGSSEQKYILNSYLDVNDVVEGDPIYQLVITVDEENILIDVERGTWVPSFDNSLVVSRWRN